MITLTLYQNRKLYSRDASRYVNHSELINLIKEGNKIQVICNKTKQDVTQRVETELVHTYLKSNPLSSDRVKNLFTTNEL